MTISKRLHAASAFRTRLFWSLTALPIALAAAAVPAADDEGANADARAVIDEIVVSARKREESALDVPDAMTVFTAQDIENGGIRSMEDFADLTPNFYFTPTYRAADTIITIRGISQAQGGEPPMAVVVDGVQLAHPSFMTQDLLDVESIEVLRGPQGSLYGRNAIAGAINITTRRPANVLEGRVSASYGSGNDTRFSGALSGPLVTDKVLFRISGSFRDFEGQVRNEFLNSLADHTRDYYVRGNLLLAPTDRLSVSLRAGYGDNVTGSLATDIVSRADFDHYDPSHLNRNVDTVDRREIHEVSAKLDYELEPFTFTSVSGYSESDSSLFGDADFTPAPVLLQVNNLLIEAFTQELRLTSSSDQRLRWLVGAFYQDRDTHNLLEIPFDNGQGSPNGTFAIRSLDLGRSEAWAVFGQTSIDVTKELELTLGLRYDEDRRNSVDREFANSGDSGTFTALQPKVQLAYEWLENLRAFATYGRGFRSGGFNAYFAVGSSSRSYEKEISENFEIGMKGSFLDDRVMLTASAFHIKFDDQQFFFLTVDPPSQNITNIDETEITGAELELAARPTDRLHVSASVGVTEATIEEFAGNEEFRGNMSPQNPSYTLSATAQYRYPLSGALDLRAYTSLHRKGTLYWDAANTLKTPPKNFINARLFLEGDRWSVGGYVENLTDTRFPAGASPYAFGPDASGRTSSGRRLYGIEAKYNF